MSLKVNKGLKSPALTQKESIQNCGGMPPSKDVKQIFKTNFPPKTPPTGRGGSKSVRV